MKMEYALSRTSVVRIKYVDAFTAAVFYAVVGNFFYSVHYMVKRFFVCIQNVRAMFFWNDQHMSVNIICYVHKRKRMLIFVNFHARNIAVNDFAKNTIFHFLKTPLYVEFPALKYGFDFPY